MEFFNECKTIEDVKKAFRDFAKRYHPDCGGNAETFKAMMQEYKIVFERLKNTHAAADGTTYEKETTETETPEAFADIISKIIFMSGCKIEIIGNWIWISGNTAVYKETLKELRFYWSRSKKAWYWKGEGAQKNFYRGHYSMQKLREKWGSKEIKPKDKDKLTA